jgi:PAT family beta-lactamase induction signal transducer AmpG
MAAFGFVGGLPLALSGFTLRQWLTEDHVSLATIGLTADIGLAYSLKFFWAPLLDHLSPPGPFARFGRRRGWLLLIQPFLALACLALALSDPANGPLLTITAGAAIALVSATQDIVIDAWRIETFPEALQGAAMAVYVWGYRVAMLVSGAWLIKAVDFVGWHGALLGVTIIVLIILPATFFAPEPSAGAPAAAGPGFTGWFERAVIDPFYEFLTRPGAFVILLYVALFNVGEAMAGVMLPSLYRALGFDRGDVSGAGNFSLVASLLIARLGLARALISTGFIQMIAMSMYVWLAVSPGDHLLLYATVVTEAFLQGLASAAYITYLSGLCSTAHSGTHYALLTSLAALASHTIAGLSGFLAAAAGWPLFYTITMFASLPGMIVMLYIIRRFPVAAEKSARR